ncbi:MAG: putative metal-binding motif-containing protein [Sandaracinaceae bacterium]
MGTLTRHFAIAIALVSITACDGETPPADAGDGGGGVCSTNADCDDGVFCNGEESCSAGASGADARGCTQGSTEDLCASNEVCDAATDMCAEPDCSTPDADGDGDAAIACGGSDCDDDDPNRFPDNVEVCDPLGVDEDCDPTTFGGRDADSDTFIDARCCNGDNCGDDCDDARASVHPGESEACDTLDNDCDGDIDEDALSTYYRDVDMDGAGDDSTTMQACGPTGQFTATVGGDCDDTEPAANPGAPEVCDGLDNDCNPSTWAVGEDDDNDGFINVACGGDDCRDDLADAYPGAPEPCNGVDNNCSGDIEDEDEDGTAATDAACTGGAMPRTDCEDTHVDVNRGHVRYEVLPFCPGEVTPCAVGGLFYCRSNADAACSDTDPRARWDWDCSGTNDFEPPVDLSCTGTCASTPVMSMEDDVNYRVCGGLGYNFSCEEGPVYTEPPSRCGLVIEHKGCCCDGIGDCSTQTFDVDLPVRCR